MAPWIPKDTVLFALDTEFATEAGYDGNKPTQKECAISFCLSTYVEGAGPIPLFHAIIYNDKLLNGHNEFTGITIDDMKRHSIHLELAKKIMLRILLGGNKPEKKRNGVKLYVCGPKKKDSSLPKDIDLLGLDSWDLIGIEIVEIQALHADQQGQPALANLAYFYS